MYIMVKLLKQQCKVYLCLFIFLYLLIMHNNNIMAIKDVDSNNCDNNVPIDNIVFSYDSQDTESLYDSEDDYDENDLYLDNLLFLQRVQKFMMFSITKYPHLMNRSFKDQIKWIIINGVQEDKMQILSLVNLIQELDLLNKLNIDISSLLAN